MNANQYALAQKWTACSWDLSSGGNWNRDRLELRACKACVRRPSVTAQVVRRGCIVIVKHINAARIRCRYRGRRIDELDIQCKVAAEERVGWREVEGNGVVGAVDLRQGSRVVGGKVSRTAGGATVAVRVKKRKGDGDVGGASPRCARDVDGARAVDVHGGDLPWLESWCGICRSEAGNGER